MVRGVRMRFAIAAVIVAGCGSRAQLPAAPQSAPPAFAAARWVPARPLYVFASPRVADAQRSARDAIELAGAVTGFDLRDAMRASAEVFGVDALHADPLAAIGVDVEGSWTVFGTGADPTLVVHLAASAQMAAFLEHQRDRGLVTRSVVVDRTEVVSAVLPVGLAISWAIDGEWMWVHLGMSGTPDDGGWFAASHGAHEASWAGNWGWAQRAAGAAAGLVGVLDLRGVIAEIAARLPHAVACAHLAASVGRVAVAVAGDEHHVSARLGLEVGSTDRLRAMLLPAPSGWDATARTAALAAQWNLDLAAARSELAPCVAAAGASLALADETGVRAARALVMGFDPDAMSGSGAIALDVASTAFFERQLDRIPLRGTLERARTFGPYRGHALSIPFSVTIEYVLERQLAIAALGEGLLARLVAPVPAPAADGSPRAAAVPPIAAIDVAPPAMSARAWQAVIDGLVERRLDASTSRLSRQLVAHLMAWRDGHLAVTAEPGEIVITASGTRRQGERK
jgi:hypothetical protein